MQPQERKRRSWRRKPSSQAASDPPTPTSARHHHRFDLRITVLPQQAGHAHHVVAVDGHSCRDEIRPAQIVLEAGARVVTADARRVVDPAMVLDEFCVQPAAGARRRSRRARMGGSSSHSTATDAGAIA